MSLLQNSNAIESGGYLISNSLRFQSASSQYLSRTPASAGNRKTMTFSCWIKKSQIGANSTLFSAGAATTRGRLSLRYTSADVLGLDFYGVGTYATSPVYRDPSSWYHVVCAIDTTQATADNRAKIYVNNSLVLSAGSLFNLNEDLAWNNNVLHYIGNSTTDTYYLDGNLTEVNFIDGQALTPSSFGSTDPASGQWVAKKYTGTYGTNGFYLPFSNGTSTTTLGYDSSGNGNNWTLTNFTRSAGVSDCWMYDVPSGNGGVAGTQPNSNYAVLNRLVAPSTWYATYNSFTKGNLTTTGTSGWTSSVFGNMGVSSGKWYWETVMTVKGGQPFPNGIQNLNNALAVGYPGSSGTTGSWGFYSDGAQIYNAGSATSYGSTFAVGDVCGAALDLDAGTLTLYKNGVSMGVAVSGLPSGLYVPAASAYDGTLNFNFGQRSFAYTPPSGFKALCTANLPAPTIAKGNQYMDATLYTGNGGSQTITNAGSFQPDFVWTKARSAASSHQLYDAVRGVNIYLKSNSTDGDVSLANTLTSFNSNGFTVGANDSGNQNTVTAVAWQWQAGKGTTSSNTSGSITSTVSVSTTAGFSIVTYTGTGANATVGHGLGVAPKMIIVKQRNGTGWWIVYHSNQAASPQAGYLALQTTNAYGADSTVWNNTAPTSSVFSIGTNGAVNTNTATYVAYCFAEIAGFSKFGSYTGNYSLDGTFVYTGFRPAFIMIKAANNAYEWLIVDTKRSPYNYVDDYLKPNVADAESANVGSTNSLDILSNGFKLRSTWTRQNDAIPYIYMAFAENPFQNSNAR